MREIALDTETTGLDPAEGHRIVEIGCVEMMNQVRTGRVYHCYINPERDMPSEAERVHGLSREFLSDKPVFSEVMQAFLDFIQDDRLVIHNAAFDMRFINHELKRAGKSPIPMSQAADTVEMARQKFPGSPASLDALCRRFAIDLSARTHHGALLDAELLADVYLELNGGRQSALILDSEGKSEKSGERIVRYDPVDYAALLAERPDFSPSADELATHEHFLSQISEPIWKHYAAG